MMEYRPGFSVARNETLSQASACGILHANGNSQNCTHVSPVMPVLIFRCEQEAPACLGAKVAHQFSVVEFRDLDVGDDNRIGPCFTAEYQTKLLPSSACKRYVSGRISKAVSLPLAPSVPTNHRHRMTSGTSLSPLRLVICAVTPSSSCWRLTRVVPNSTSQPKRARCVRSTFSVLL